MPCKRWANENGMGLIESSVFRDIVQLLYLIRILSLLYIEMDTRTIIIYSVFCIAAVDDEGTRRVRKDKGNRRKREKCF